MYLPSLAILGLSCAVARVEAQGSTFSGRVLSDSGLMLAGAEVVLNGPQSAQRTDSLGQFRFAALRAGLYVVGVRTPGYAPRFDTIEVADAGEVRREYRLARIEATLAEVSVRTTPLDRKLFEFYERRRTSVGRFLDSAEFANRRGTRTSDRLATLPGILIQRGRGMAAYVANTRVRLAGQDPRKWCRALVWLDGINVGTEFNVNELDPSVIAAVEWYAGEASIPARFNVPMRGGERYCGILLIWLR